MVYSHIVAIGGYSLLLRYTHISKYARYHQRIHITLSLSHLCVVVDRPTFALQTLSGFLPKQKGKSPLWP